MMKSTTQIMLSIAQQIIVLLFPLMATAMSTWWPIASVAAIVAATTSICRCKSPRISVYHDSRQIPPKHNRLLADMLKNMADQIYHYHEHDSLLENKVEDQLTEEEKLDMSGR